MAILTKISWVKAELATNQQHIADFILAQPGNRSSFATQKAQCPHY